MPKLIPARYDQGLAAYRAGLTIREVATVFDEIEKMHEAPDLTHEQHSEIAASTPSFICGFFDGVLEDFRRLAGSPAITRRGQTA